MAMKLYLSGFYHHDIWTDSTQPKVVGIFTDADLAKRAAEKAAREYGHGTPFVREYLTDVANPDKWEKRPDWLGESIYEKKEADV